MAFKRVIIRRVGPLSWLLAAMKRFLLFLFFLICSSQTFASYKSSCVITGRVASDVDKKTYFSEGKEKTKYLIFRLKVESSVGLGSSEDQWCSDVFAKKMNRAGTVNIRIYYPQNEIVIPPIGETATYLWAYFESEYIIQEEFSPYVEPIKAPSGV